MGFEPIRGLDAHITAQPRELPHHGECPQHPRHGFYLMELRCECAEIRGQAEPEIEPYDSRGDR